MSKKNANTFTGCAATLKNKAALSRSGKQMKVGYKPGQIDFTRYRGQTLVIDKGNPHFSALKAEGAKHGIKVVEGHITNQEAKFWADAMQMETKLTGNRHSVLVPKAYQGAKTALAAHNAGLSAAKSGATAGAGFSLGRNLVQVAKGNKTVGEAAGEVVADTAAAGAISYGMGTAGSLIAGTELGAAALSTAGSIGAAASSAPIIGTALGAATIVAGPALAVGCVIGGLLSLFDD